MTSTIPQEYIIDGHVLSRKLTLNSHIKDDIIQTSLKCIYKGSIDEANVWIAELLSTGLYHDIWLIIFTSYFRFISHLCPRMIDYLNQKYILFNQIKKSITTKTKSVINICNNQEIRNHLAEIITVLCLLPKTIIIVPPDINKYQPNDITEKSHKLLQYMNVGTNSELNIQLMKLIDNYYLDDMDNCVYIINWFVMQQDIQIQPIEQLVISSSLSKHCMWLVWQFILLQQKNIFSNNHKELLDILLTFYIYLYRKKSYETCVDILSFLLYMTKHTDKVQWTQIIPSNNPEVIVQCASINFVYQDLNQTAKSQPKSNPKSNSKSNPKLSRSHQKEQQKRELFYKNPKNVAYIETLNDMVALQTKTS